MSTPEKPRWVAGSMGPTTKAISVTGGVTFAELIEHYYQQAKGLNAMPARGPLSVTVPGAVDGWFALHQRF